MSSKCTVCLKSHAIDDVQPIIAFLALCAGCRRDVKLVLEQMRVEELSKPTK